MAKGIEDVQSYLLKMDLRYEEPREGIWVLSGLDGIDKLVITLAGPVLVFRVKVMELPQRNREGLYRTPAGIKMPVR